MSGWIGPDGNIYKPKSKSSKISDTLEPTSRGSKVRSPTIDTRWDKVIQQLRRLRYCPATVEAKVKAILAKVYVVAFTAAVIDVFGYRNDNHNADWFVVACVGDHNDIDPVVQILARRAMQVRGAIWKRKGATTKVEGYPPGVCRHRRGQIS